MRVSKHEADGEVMGVTLSRRNLLTLLAKLDGAPDPSACMILAPENELFFVAAEEDDKHYHHPERSARGVAGAMHPETERVLRGAVTDEEQAYSLYGSHVRIQAPSE